MKGLTLFPFIPKLRNLWFEILDRPHTLLWWIALMPKVQR